MNSRCSITRGPHAGKRSCLKRVALAAVIVSFPLQTVTAATKDVSLETTRNVLANAPRTETNPGADWRPPVTPKITLPPMVDAKTAKMLEEKWGVSLLFLRRTAEGFMLDFRFRVHDADKALPLFDRKNKPFVTVARSNAKLPVPAAAKIGSFRTTNRGKNIQANRNYYILFANPDRHVKAGDRVSLAIGDFKLNGLTVY